MTTATLRPLTPAQRVIADAMSENALQVAGVSL